MSTHTPTLPLDAERLIALLRRQAELYGRLRNLSEQQRTLIAGDRPELLLSVLSERQTIVSDLSKNNAALAPFRRQWDELYPSMPEAQREQARVLLGEINGVAGAILRSDEEDYSLLNTKKNEVGRAMSGISGARAAATAYGRPVGGRAVGGSEYSG